jgi:hypothetical protein
VLHTTAKVDACFTNSLLPHKVTPLGYRRALGVTQGGSSASPRIDVVRVEPVSNQGWSLLSWDRRRVNGQGG